MSLWDGRESFRGLYAWKDGSSSLSRSSVLDEKWLLLRGSVGVSSLSSSAGGRGGDSTIELS